MFSYTLEDIKVGDRVTWRSQSLGVSKEKSGTVRAILLGDHNNRNPRPEIVGLPAEFLHAIQKFRRGASPAIAKGTILVELDRTAKQSAVKVGIPRPRQITNVQRDKL